MKTNLPAIPFIETSHQDKDFFNQKFIPEMLANINGREPKKLRGFSESNEKYEIRLSEWLITNQKVLFKDWICKKRTNWMEFKNEENKIEFYSKTYKINCIELPFPKTIDQFITDCNRLDIDLLWRNDLVDLDINIYHVTSANAAKEHITELLTIMDKI